MSSCMCICLFGFTIEFARYNEYSVCSVGAILDYGIVLKQIPYHAWRYERSPLAGYKTNRASDQSSA